MSAKNVIELNGKRYDAASGRLLSSTAHTGHIPAKPGRAIDDFVKHPKIGTHPTSKPASKPKTASRTKAKPATPHRPERAKTLMRSTVRKPELSTKPKPRVQTLAGNLPPHATLHPKFMERLTGSEHRLGRAKSTPRSQLVSHFANVKPALAKKLQSLDIKPQSKTATTAHAAADITPGAAMATAKSRANELLMAGLARADSHLQPPAITPHQRHKLQQSVRYFSITAACLIIVISIGLLIYHSAPSLQINYVSARAGLHATLPTYQPAGFSFVDPIVYKNGLVITNFHSAGRHYSLTEQASTWDSDTLRDNFVMPLNLPYHTTEAGGRLIYLYGSGGATWVNGGIWYQVSDTANLSTAQLVSIATSL